MLSFEQALMLASHVFAEGRVRGSAPLAVAVVDASGTPVVMHRADGAPPMWARIALAKAQTAVQFGCSSAQVQQLSEEYPALMGSIAPLVDGPMVTAAGGIVLRREGAVVGAVGVSGDTSETDAACAAAAAEQLGLG
jgi:uncharacterized protein GlcG (DUF336 family)